MGGKTLKGNMAENKIIVNTACINDDEALELAERVCSF